MVDKYYILRKSFLHCHVYPYMAEDEEPFESLLDQGSSSREHRWGPNSLNQLSPADFEAVTGAMITAEGFEVEYAGPTVEGGIDLVAQKSGFIRSKTTIISVTPPGGTISPATVKQVERARTMNGAGHAIIVRPAPFGDDIRSVAADIGTIELLAGENLIDRLTAADVSPP